MKRGPAPIEQPPVRPSIFTRAYSRIITSIILNRVSAFME